MKIIAWIFFSQLQKLRLLAAMILFHIIVTTILEHLFYEWIILISDYRS